MKIKEVITKTGLTDRAIRLYIEKDLVKPECDENYNGRKSIDFSEKDVEQLKNIALLRKADFSITEIKALQEGGETAQKTIKEYINRTNEKIQFNSEIIERISPLVNEEDITIEIICEKLSCNLANEKVPAEDMELSPKEHKEKTVFTVISVVGMVLSGIAGFLTLIFNVGYYRFPAFVQYNVSFDEPLIETVFSLLFITIIKSYFIVQFALCFIVFIIYRRNKKIGKKKDKKKAIAVFFVVIWAFSLLLTPFSAMMQAFAFESRTENPDNYLKIDHGVSILYNAEELFVFPRAIPVDAESEFPYMVKKYSDTTKYFYRYAPDLFGYAQDIYAEWELFSHNYDYEKERILSLVGIVREEKKGDWNIVYFCEEIDKDPDSDFCEYYRILFFAYNDNTQTVRYVFAAGEEQYTDTPYFTTVEW